ncbi:MAG: DUF928 domain-containing protein [Nostocales cyanobacterium]|nr:MAG: DUF928 domain-containing protein [Nostocales cyanobacterium]
MHLSNYSLYLRKLFRIISPAILITSFLPTQLLAQPFPIKISLKFPSGDPRGTPETTVGGGKRGVSCITLEKGKPSLTALMPKRDNKSLTVSGTPEFYFYVPKTQATKEEFVLGEFILKKGEEDIYKQTFTLPTQPGIVKLQLPVTSSLKIGSTYTWYFLIICDPEDRSGDQYTVGTIEKIVISPSLQEALQQATPVKRTEIYAHNDLWPETVSNMVKLRTNQPNEWKELLESVGLEMIAEEPLLQCCQANPNP